MLLEFRLYGEIQIHMFSYLQNFALITSYKSPQLTISKILHEIRHYSFNNGFSKNQYTPVCIDVYSYRLI